MHQIVNDHYLRKVSVFDNPQVFDSEPSLGLETVGAMQKTLDVFGFRVKVVDDGFSVVFSRRCKDIHLKWLADRLEEDLAERTNIEPDHPGGGIELDFGLLVVLDWVDESLIEVQHQDFFLLDWMNVNLPVGSGRLSILCWR